MKSGTNKAVDGTRTGVFNCYSVLRRSSKRSGWAQGLRVTSFSFRSSGLKMRKTNNVDGRVSIPSVESSRKGGTRLGHLRNVDEVVYRNEKKRSTLGGALRGNLEKIGNVGKRIPGGAFQGYLEKKGKGKKE